LLYQSHGNLKVKNKKSSTGYAKEIPVAFWIPLSMLSLGNTNNLSFSFRDNLKLRLPFPMTEFQLEFLKF